MSLTKEDAYAIRKMKRNTQLMGHMYTELAKGGKDHALYAMCGSIISGITTGMGVQRAFALMPTTKIPIMAASLGFMAAGVSAYHNYQTINNKSGIYHKIGSQYLQLHALFAQLESNMTQSARLGVTHEEELRAKFSLLCNEKEMFEKWIDSDRADDQCTFLKAKAKVHGYSPTHKDICTLTESEVYDWTARVKIEEMKHAEKIAQELQTLRPNKS